MTSVIEEEDNYLVEDASELEFQAYPSILGYNADLDVPVTFYVDDH